MIVSARALNPDLPIIARAATQEGVARLARLGAEIVVHPELEGGLAVVRHTLLRLGYPLSEVQHYADTVRREHYDAQINTTAEQQVLQQLVDAANGIQITWLRLPDAHPVVGLTLAQADIRTRTGASVVAIMRDGHITPNPKSQTVLQAKDRLGLIGDEEQIDAAEQLLQRQAAEDEGGGAGSNPGGQSR